MALGVESTSLATTASESEDQEAATSWPQTYMHAAVRLFWSIAGLFSFLPPWIIKGGRESHPAQGDLDSAGLIGALQDVDRMAQNVSSIKSVGSVLSEILKYKDDVDARHEQWKALMSDMDLMRALLLDFDRDLAQTGRYSQLSDRMTSALQDLSKNLVHVVTTLQVYLELRKRYRIFVVFRRRRPLTEVQGCSDNVRASLEAIKILVTPRTIYTASLDTLAQKGTPLDITSTATPQRYRLVNCEQLTQHKVLRIDEYTDFPHVKYSAISYVWRGNSVDPDSGGGDRFSVKGAKDADPISINVLNHACAASLARGISHLWLDRLCIMQTSSDDKHWQISRMFNVYQSCGLCIVLAGGVQRLVRLDEETAWIHRGWTLQEVLAPASVVVLFAWKLGPGKGRAGDDAEGLVEEVIPRQSAMAPFSFVLNACVTGNLSFTGISEPKKFMVEASIFSAQPGNFTYNDIPFWRPQRKILSPNVAAVAVIMDKVLSSDSDPDARNYAIWQSALMRTSSRPVDMVFSIMGLFGITLDTRAFHKNDRVGATIALAQEILNRGGRASWLGVSFRVDPCRQLSTFPSFPRTSVAGKAFVRVAGGRLREVSELVDSEYPYSAALVPMPQGTMDSAGYLTFSGKAVRIVPATEGQNSQEGTAGGAGDDAAAPTLIAAVDRSSWAVQEELGQVDAANSAQPRAFAVLLGWFNGYYPGATPAHEANNVRAMLIEEHAPEKFHLRSFFSMGRKTRPWVSAWKEHTFCVGGPDEWRRPDPGSEEEGGEEEPHAITVVDRLTMPVGSLKGPVTLKDLTARASRWAVPQSVLENNLG